MVKKLSCVCCGILKHFPHTFTTEQCLLKLAVQWRPLYLCHHFFYRQGTAYWDGLYMRENSYRRPLKDKKMSRTWYMSEKR